MGFQLEDGTRLDSYHPAGNTLYVSPNYLQIQDVDLAEGEVALLYKKENFNFYCLKNCALKVILISIFTKIISIVWLDLLIKHAQLPLREKLPI